MQQIYKLLEREGTVWRPELGQWINDCNHSHYYNNYSTTNLLVKKENIDNPCS